MKVRFLFNNRWYIAPSKNEAYLFMTCWNEIVFTGDIKRLGGSWPNLTTIEVAPSHAQLIPLDLSKIDFKK